MKLKYRIWNETENRYLKSDEATVTADGKIVGWDGAKDDCVVEVWTGMVDAKGVEIYEGDVVSGVYLGGATVVWSDRWSLVETHHPNPWDYLDLYEDTPSEVIGNIHEGVK